MEEKFITVSSHYSTRLKKKINLKDEIDKSSESETKKAYKKVLILENINRLSKGRQKVHNGFENNVFPKEKQTQGKKVKILTSKQKLQRLQIDLAQLKSGNTSEKLLNEIRKIIYFLHRAKETTKKVYTKKMSSTNL